MDNNRARITIKLGGIEHTGGRKNGQEADTEINGADAQKSLTPVEDKLQMTQGEQVAEADRFPVKAAEITHDKAKEDIEDEWQQDVDIPLYGPKYVVEEDEWPAPAVIQTSRYKNRKRDGGGAKRILAVAASVAGAVSVGLLFGFVILHAVQSGLIGAGHPKTIDTGSTVQSKMSEGTDQSGPAPLDQTAPDAGAAAGQAATGQKISVKIPAQSFFAVQAGVFNDQASAAPLLEKIKSAGWPSTFIGEKPMSLILGLSVNRDDALAMARQYKDVEVFIKELKEPEKMISLQPNAGAALTPEKWDSWMKKESEFVQNLTGVIGTAVNGGKLQEDVLKKLADSHREFLRLGQELAGSLPEKNQALANRLMNDYSKAVTAVGNLKDQQTQGYIWQAEQAFLDACKSTGEFYNSFK